MKKVTKLSFVALILMAISTGIYAQPNYWRGKGRIAISSDGNKHDDDDWGGTAMTLMVLAKAGLQDKLVLYAYSDHIWGSERNDRAEMIESAVNGGSRFCYETTEFIEAVANPEKAYNAMRDAINESTEQNPLFILAGGPMHVIGEGLKRANASARNYVTVIQHSKFNQFHSDGTQGQGRPGENHSGWNWDELLNLYSNVNFVKIKDQNGNSSVQNGFNTQDISGNKWQPWYWMRDHSDDNVKWVYARAQKMNRPDWSDAGMAWYLIKNGDQNGGPNKLKNFIGSGKVASCGGNNGGGTNTISFENPPTSVAKGASINVRVNYEATTQLELALILNSPTGAWLASTKKTVSAGSGNATLTISNTSSLAAANGYKLICLIRPVGGNFNSNFDKESALFNLTSTNSSLPENLVSNPGFETGNLNSWAGWGTRNVVSTAFSGSKGVKVTGAASLIQVVDVTPNTRYELSAKAKVASGSSASLGIKEYGGVEKKSVITSISYTTSTVSFTTGSSNTKAKLFLYVSGSGKVAYGDDFKIVKSNTRGVKFAKVEPVGKNVSVYPNPFSSSLTLSLSDDHVFDGLHVMDVSGRVFYSEDINSRSIIMLNNSDISDMKAGIYFIQLSGNNTIETLKLIKE